jgi:hypothetical protein
MKYQGVGQNYGSWYEWCRALSDVVNRLLVGQMDVTTFFTLTANAASSTLTDSRININTAIILTPTTANASAEIGNGTIYISETGRVKGSVVLTHANNAQADRTYRVALIG